jgi:hypothetical protein
MRSRATAPLLAAIAALALTPASASAFSVGINAGPYLSDSAASSIQTARFGLARIPVFWRDVQPTATGGYSWTGTDRQMLAAANHGLKVTVVLNGAPEWAISNVSTANRGRADTLPSDPAQYAAFVKAFVIRYGPNGEFWANPANSTVLARPLHAVQVWNEPNISEFAGRNYSSTKAYEPLLRLSVKAVSAAQPDPKQRVLVLPAGVAKGGGKQIDPMAYLISLWKVLKTNKMSATSFTWDVHLYTGAVTDKAKRVNATSTATTFGSAVASISRSFQTAGCKGCKFRIGEFGWSSSPLTNGFRCVGSEAMQRNVAAAVLAKLKSIAARYLVSGADWYRWDDSDGDFPQRQGLVATTGIAKPVLAVLSSYAGS